MNARRLIMPVLGGVAAVLLVLAIAACIRCAGVLRTAGPRVEGRARVLRLLDGLQAEQESAEADRQRLVERFSGRPLALASMVESVLPGVRIEDVRESRQPVADGWMVREREVAFMNVAFADIHRLVLAIESNRPPWRLEGCRFQAGPEKGRGTVNLTWQTWEKVE